MNEVSIAEQFSVAYRIAELLHQKMGDRHEWKGLSIRIGYAPQFCAPQIRIKWTVYGTEHSLDHVVGMGNVSMVGEDGLANHLYKKIAKQIDRMAPGAIAHHD